MMTDKEIKDLCERVKRASRRLALVDTDTKNKVLIAMSRALNKNAGAILKANKKDIKRARAKGLKQSLIDRLTLTDARIRSIADSLAAIAKLKDPVGHIIETARRPNGLFIKKVRVPIGVILIIYESRPNITSDCVGLCLKSSNGVILRGGSEAVNSSMAIFSALIAAAARFKGFPSDAIAMIKDTDRRVVDSLLGQAGFIDLVMPRGGESLIREVARKSTIPVIKHYKGVCHTYVDEYADLEMAGEVCFNAKIQRPGVCNAMESMLVHEKAAKRFLPKMLARLQGAGVQIRGCSRTMRLARGVKKAQEADYYTEYLDLILSVKVVRDIDEAIGHIMKYGSGHSDAIVTENKKNAAKFLNEVDSACVYLNASTRFTDGGEFGKGAEIGISTDKIHARGPVGLEELTSYKYVIYGSGQVRK